MAMPMSDMSSEIDAFIQEDIREESVGKISHAIKETIKIDKNKL